MRKYLDLMKIVIKNLRRRRLRTWLTTLGLIIGVLTVFTIFSLSEGTKRYLLEYVESLGKYRALIFPGKGSSFATSLGRPFTEYEIKKIEKIKYVEYIIPVMLESSLVRYKKKTIPTSIFIIPFKDLQKIEDIGYKITIGSMVRKKDSCIVGNTVYKVLDIKIRDYIYLESLGIRCKVVGILESSENTFRDISIYIPEELYERNRKIKKEYFFILAKTKKDASKIKDYLEEKIKKVIGRDVTVFTPQDIIKTFNQFYGGISIFMLAIGIISIIISAIGIMNTMYMAVTERVREIGIMKAIGAKNKDILFLFLVESGLIGLVGGVIGVILGIIAVKIVEIFFFSNQFFAMTAYIGIDLIVESLLFSFFVGIVAGIAPAIQASKISIIEAIRKEF